jgi:hypothetical protein
MSRPFEALSETLLKAGIAPRHVRRYARELEEHLDDLVALQKERGYDGEDASLRARALLGPDEELADAMIRCRQFRSLMARAPWLVFGVVPPLLLLGLLTGVGLTMLGVWAVLPGYHLAPPAWLGVLAHTWSTLANFAAGPLAAAYFVVIAVNQRQPWRWPLFAVASTAVFSAFTIFVVRLPDKGRLGEIGVGLGATDVTLWENFARLGLTLAAVIACYAVARRQIRALA